MPNVQRAYDQIVREAKRVGAKRVVLFGSRARGDNLPKSDIDIAVEGCPDCAALRDALDNDVETLLGIDLVDFDASRSDELRREIARDGIVLYEEV